METRARYVLIGFFTLAVVAAGFAFVYWLNTVGGLGERAIYKIRYENTVSGLLEGSAVLFNGVRVGEVTALDLDAAAPSAVTATIAIDRGTPIGPDTKAGIEFQGLMGAPAVSLLGGSQVSALAPGADGVPLIAAEPGSGQSMTEAARQVLRHIDDVVSDNAEALRTAIANIAKFSEALGRNTDRVDNVMAGLERMTGGGAKAPETAFDLSAARTFPPFDKPAQVQIVIRDPTALDRLARDEVLERGEGGLAPLAAKAKWTDMLANVVQARTIQSFENAGLLGQVSRASEGAAGGYQLLLDIRNFEYVPGPEPAAKVAFAAKILAEDGRMIDGRMFEASRPAQGSDPKSVVAALDSAFAALEAELVVWAAGAIRSASQ